MKPEKIQVNILQPVAAGGVHYRADPEKAVPLSKADADILIVRGKARLAKPAKTSKPAAE